MLDAQRAQEELAEIRTGDRLPTDAELLEKQQVISQIKEALAQVPASITEADRQTEKSRQAHQAEALNDATQMRNFLALVYNSRKEHERLGSEGEKKILEKLKDDKVGPEDRIEVNMSSRTQRTPSAMQQHRTLLGQLQSAGVDYHWLQKQQTKELQAEVEREEAQVRKQAEEVMAYLQTQNHQKIHEFLQQDKQTRQTYVASLFRAMKYANRIPGDPMNTVLDKQLSGNQSMFEAIAEDIRKTPANLLK